MSRQNLDLTGTWDGEFEYPTVPEAGPKTPFLATLSERGGVLSGSIIEPHEVDGSTAHSTILGQRIGRNVHFAKDYSGAGRLYRETVFYDGVLSEDGETITGTWRIEHWRGPFSMTRSNAAGAKVATEETAEA